MSRCCILANVGQHPVIRSGYIVPILKLHANINADTDADADGICIKVYASHSFLFVGVMNYHKVYFPFLAQMHEGKIQNILFSIKQGYFIVNFNPIILL